MVFLLALVLATRWISIPSIMIVAAAAVYVHLEFGWQEISDLETDLANERVMESAD